MIDIKTIEQEAKATVGYAECTNKQSFLVGVGVGFSKSEEFYSEEIKHWKMQAKTYEVLYENISRDIKTFSSIINKYSDNH